VDEATFFRAQAVLDRRVVVSGPRQRNRLDFPLRGWLRARILHVWEQRRAEANERTTEQERRVKMIQQKFDRLDEAFLYSESIDLTSYSRQRDKLREELTPAQIDRDTGAFDELDERILPRIRPLGAGVARRQAAAAVAILPGRNCVRRKSIQSNRDNGTTFQLLGAV
jgi:hypothetical protein